MLLALRKKYGSQRKVKDELEQYIWGVRVESPRQMMSRDYRGTVVVQFPARAPWCRICTQHSAYSQAFLALD